MKISYRVQPYSPDEAVGIYRSCGTGDTLFRRKGPVSILIESSMIPSPATENRQEWIHDLPQLNNLMNYIYSYMLLKLQIVENALLHAGLSQVDTS